MFFGILLTPKQFILSIVAFAIGMTVFLWLGFRPDPTSPNPIIVNLNKAVQNEKSLSTDFNGKYQKGKSAILNVKTSSIDITPYPDLRLKLSVTIIVRNVTDQAAIGSIIRLVVKSDSLPNHFIKKDIFHDFEEPLMPGESRSVSLNLNGSTTTTLFDNLFEPVSHNGLSGKHSISTAEAELSALKIKGQTHNAPKHINVGPTDNEREKLRVAKERVEKCSNLIALSDKKDPVKFRFTDEQLNQNQECLTSLGALSGLSLEALSDIYRGKP